MKTFIIAEAGVNHNGNLQNAKKLIDVAVDAGCDAVKFQTFKAENLVTKEARKAEYQIKNTRKNESQYSMLQKLEIDRETHIELINYCKDKNILFLSTPFDEESADLLEKLDIAIFKIPSGEITNKPFLKYIAQKQRPIILSTGMATLGEVEEALDWIYEEGNKEVTLLHCTTDYPTAMEDVNLNAMLTMKSAFKVEVGYSDHTLGIEVPVAAVALGAKVVEKHFTLDKNMDGPDHKASLEPEELKSMVQYIRNTEVVLGDGIKKPKESEKINIYITRKYIVAKKDIRKGERIEAEMLQIKRTGKKGMEPKYINNIINKRAVKDIEKGEPLRLGLFS